MLLKGFFSSYKKSNPLALKVLTSIIICSSLITLVATLSQLYFDYQFEKRDINAQIRQIESSSLASLENSLWEISPDQIQLQLDGIAKLRDIEHVSLITPYNEKYQSGIFRSQSIQKKEYQLKHLEADKEYALGTLHIVISLENLQQRLMDKTLLILLTQGMKTFLVSLFILSLFHHLVTQHLARMAHYAKEINLENLNQPLVFNRKAASSDELSLVADALNSMQLNMRSDFKRRKEAEQALFELNTQLEQRVEERTKQLASTNHELQSSLDNLQKTQSQLIESQKMASLGNLVAGVAHEISTPLGIGYTAASYLEQQAQQHSGELAEITLESSQLICQNLERAASLVTAFKQVSVDQASQKRRTFNLKSYLEEIILSLKPKLRNSNAVVSIHCDSAINLDSYPGSYYQIMNNLVLNSLIHARTSTRDKINISVTVSDFNDDITIDYKDDGLGLDAQWMGNVFEPFATSKRNIGCSGLGMHICYNLVHHLLKGEIYCLAADKGAHFQIRLFSVKTEQKFSGENAIYP
jgi:signal transduction histidine kinase